MNSKQFQSFSDATLTVCPNCGGKLRKVYGSVGVVFKGSGFYRTDSREAAKSTSQRFGQELRVLDELVELVGEEVGFRQVGQFQFELESQLEPASAPAAAASS